MFRDFKEGFVDVAPSHRVVPEDQSAREMRLSWYGAGFGGGAGVGNEGYSPKRRDGARTAEGQERGGKKRSQ